MESFKSKADNKMKADNSFDLKKYTETGSHTAFTFCVSKFLLYHEFDQYQSIIKVTL